MAKKAKAPVTLKCAETGRTFEYRGYGRPPKYHPDVVADVQKRKRKAARDAKRPARKNSAQLEAAI